jgi:IK cytokine
VEERRRYLGGDRDHSILVKGLDIVLLQQNKARAAQSTDDDDSLEQAFQGVSTESRVPKKRTREDIIKELKEKRQQGGAHEEVAKDEAVLLEEAKKAGKFKPIGFKPIGAPAEGKAKKKGKDLDRDGERKKKKRRIGEGGVEAQKLQPEMPPPPIPEKVAPSLSAEPEPESIREDFDIFAGAGDYQGIDLGDDDDDETGPAEGVQVPESHMELPTVSQRWFADDEEQQPDISQIAPSTSKCHSPPPPPSDDEEREEPTRLIPLQSSAIPSIRDLLAMDGAQDKRKKRKDKKKSGKDADLEEKKKATAEAKADRDYKRSVFAPPTHRKCDMTILFAQIKDIYREEGRRIKQHKIILA